MLKVLPADPPTPPAAVTLPDEMTLCDQIAGATPGTIIVYHVGHLAFDRTATAGVLPEWRRRELSAVANRALRLADAGWVHLLQRRVTAMSCEYLIIVRPRPRPRHANASLVHTAAVGHQKHTATDDACRLGLAA